MRTSGYKLILKRRKKKVKFGNWKSIRIDQSSLVRIVGQKEALTMGFDWVYELRLHYVREGTGLDDPEIIFSLGFICFQSIGRSAT